MVYTLTSHHRRTLGTLAILALIGGCSDEGSGTADECIETTYDRQPTQRFAGGRTFYLPTIRDSAACESLRWQLGSGPDANTNAVVHGDDGVPRFTPVVPGDYRFQLSGTAEERELTVIDGRSLPFHNVNYFGSQSAAMVGEELWVADVYSPTVTRLDAATLAVRDAITTGSWPVALGWRPGMDEVLVAQRGDDTLGFIDVETGTLTDAVWVGDEPANVVVSSDGQLAWVALSTEAAIAVVDVEAHAVLTRIETVNDPLAMALSPDGATLAVASHRSGQTTRRGFSDDPVEEERDLAFIDTATDTVRQEVIDLGSTFTGLSFSEDGGRLFVAVQRNDTMISQVDPAGLSFQNVILALDASTGEELAAVDLAKQDSSGGFATFPHQLVAFGGSLWAAVEASDLLLELDPETLAERRRVPAPGRPRAAVVTEAGVWVHGAQGFSVTRLAGAEATSVVVGEDPRPPRVAAGLALFTGAGEDLFGDRACNSCHTDGVGDTQVWQAGPFPVYYASRSQFWLEGTERLGWDAYVSNATNFAFGVSGNTGRRLNTEQTLDLSAFLRSVAPPPAANGWTTRDGRLTEQAERGRALYEGTAACSSCHPLPLTTNQQLLEEGITEGAADVPALVGAYRHGVWLKHGEARTLRDSVVQVAASLGTSLADEGIDDITRYLQEMTDRHFFLLSSVPLADAERAAPEAPVRLTFNVPVWDDPSNLEHIELRDGSGAAVAVRADVDGRVVTLTPESSLQAGADYTVVVAESFASLDERSMFAPLEHAFSTASAPALKLEGEYAWTVQFPAIDFELPGFDLDNTIPTTAVMTATPTPSGATLLIDYGGGFISEKTAIIEGETIYLPNLIIAVGGSGVDSTEIEGRLVDDDGDGVADGSGGLMGFSGPGMREEGISWELARPSVDCEPGASGDVEVSVTSNGQGEPVIDWGEVDALGLYVIDPGASPPAGGGAPVTGGDVYWAVQVEQFPMGFSGPVTYGEVPAGAVDATESVGGSGLGAAVLQPGRCYQFAVTTTDFQSGQVVLVWE